jgi:hypothetical protein
MRSRPEGGPESEGSVESKYEGLRRGLRSRRRDDHALELFREAEANLGDIRRVDRLLLELGRCYNPLTNGAIVELAIRRRIVEHLQAGNLAEARRLLDEQLLRYAKVEEREPPSAG